MPGDRPIPPDRVQKIALFRLGHYGNSASTFFFFLYGTVDVCAWQKETYRVAQEMMQGFFSPHFGRHIMPAGISAFANIFGVSAGSVTKCKERFTGAVNKLADSYIERPSESRRAELALFSWEKFGLRGCIGSVDGSQVPLAYV